MSPYRVLVVDDSAFMRKMISDLIMQNPEFTIVATANTGAEALHALEKWKPDVITMDLEMPEMNGLEALKRIMESQPTPVIMLSGISDDGTRETIAALQLGAFDFILKPSKSTSVEQVGQQLQEKLKIAVQTLRKPAVWNQPEQPQVKPENKPAGRLPVERNPDPSPLQQKGKPAPSTNAPQVKPEQKLPKATGKRDADERFGKANEKANEKTKVITKAHSASLEKPPTAEASVRSRTFRDLVAVGTSTGGPRALHQLITSLPEAFPAPVLVVQHMPPKFTHSLAQRLDSFSKVHVTEAKQGEKVKAGTVYIAPGGFHMELAKGEQGYYIRLSETPPRQGHRPSVDVLFESLLPFQELRRHVVIMTGMGSDGAKGIKALANQCIPTAIAEAEETCVVYGMPRSAIEGGGITKVLPLHEIASHVVKAVIK